MKQSYLLTTYFILMSFHLLASCSDKKVDFIFNRTEHIVVDTIPIQHLFSPAFMAAKKDMLIMTSNGADNSGNMLHLYRLPTLEYMYSNGSNGRGPNEFSSFPLIAQTTHMNRLYLWGYTPLTIKEWEIRNDSLSLNNTYTLNQYENFNQLHIAQDSLFIYSAIPGDFSIKKYNLDKHKKTGKIALKMDKESQPYYSPNYGLVAANESVIVYAYYYKKQFDIYDISSLRLKKRITGIYDDQHIDLDDFDSNVQHYTNIVAGEKYFYALYRGRPRKERTINSDVIEVFDYDGNPVVKYTFEICPQYFTIDESNNVLYGFSFDFEDYILRCSLY